MSQLTIQQAFDLAMRHYRDRPLMDAPKFARNIEAAYRRMWRTWCETAV